MTQSERIKIAAAKTGGQCRKLRLKKFKSLDPLFQNEIKTELINVVCVSTLTINLFNNNHAPEGPDRDIKMLDSGLITQVAPSMIRQLIN